MATINLYLDKRSTKKDGTHPLKILISHKGSTTINLNIYLKEEDWNGKEIIGDVKNKKNLNRYIDRRMVIAKNLLYDLLSEGKLKKISAKELKEIIENSNVLEDDDDTYLFKDHIDKFIESKSNNRTKEIYLGTKNMISKFTDIDKLTFEEINVCWLKSFDSFMTSSVNSRSIHLRNIRAIFNDAINEDLIPQNLYPFRKFKIKREETIKRSLTIDQLISLRDYPCEQHQEKYRDIFMLIFYLIGINTIDLLRIDKIIDGRIGYIRAKTGRLYNIEVLPEAQKIIDKYSPGEKYLLNFMDTYNNYKDFTKKINENLQKIGTVSKDEDGNKIIIPLIDGITTYYARHTWATIAAKLNIPKETIAAALGHGSKTVTDIYIDFDLAKIDRANKKVLKYVSEYKSKKPSSKEKKDKPTSK